ncbi:hypothetical protein [Peribacillus sp. FSL E2-0218]|uniref:hypothetical protein n=1 Tax=Peribacillus sp. FSL E2-0218 TaxID=2921364 RepID=UPI0030EBB3D9
MIRWLCLSICFIFGFNTFGNVVAANTGRIPLEEALFDIGYRPVEEALKTCESYFNKKIKIPYKLPPIAFTHQLGRCNHTIGINNELEVELINENIPKNHYVIRVRPSEHRINFTQERIDKKYKISNDTYALYVTNRAQVCNYLIFEKDGWQYMLGIDKRISDKVPPKVLIEIADSFL